MKEREMGELVRQVLRRVVLPASLGLGLALSGCGHRAVSSSDAGITTDGQQQQYDDGMVAKYGAPFPEADGGAVTLYGAPFPEPDAGYPAGRYGAPFPDSGMPGGKYGAPFPPDAA
jgi:hypothetical protein